jgi:predicted nucleic-acid-binding protein
MIGLDTNVLLRLLLDDDAAESPRARALVAAHGSVPGSLRLCDAVLLETLWTLTRGYRFKRQALAQVFGKLLAEPAFAVADRERLAEVLRRYGTSKADIGDAFIAVDNERAGCTWTATFDADAAGVAGMKLVP